MITRPAPEVVDPAYAVHQAGLERGEFLVPECEECGSVQWPPRPVCPACHGEGFSSRSLGLVGTVYTFSIIHRAFHPWFAARTPYAVAVVELERAVRSIGFFEGPLDALACNIEVSGEILDRGGSPALVWRARG